MIGPARAVHPDGAPEFGHHGDDGMVPGGAELGPALNQPIRKRRQIPRQPAFGHPLVCMRIPTAHFQNRDPRAGRLGEETPGGGGKGREAARAAEISAALLHGTVHHLAGHFLGRAPFLERLGEQRITRIKPFHLVQQGRVRRRQARRRPGCNRHATPQNKREIIPDGEPEPVGTGLKVAERAVEPALHPLVGVGQAILQNFLGVEMRPCSLRSRDGGQHQHFFPFIKFRERGQRGMHAVTPIQPDRAAGPSRRGQGEPAPRGRKIRITIRGKGGQPVEPATQDNEQKPRLPRERRPGYRHAAGEKARPEPCRAMNELPPRGHRYLLWNSGLARRSASASRLLSARPMAAIVLCRATAANA